MKTSKQEVVPTPEETKSEVDVNVAKPNTDDNEPKRVASEKTGKDLDADGETKGTTPPASVVDERTSDPGINALMADEALIAKQEMLLQHYNKSKGDERSDEELIAKQERLLQAHHDTPTRPPPEPQALPRQTQIQIDSQPGAFAQAPIGSREFQIDSLDNIHPETQEEVPVNREVNNDGLVVATEVAHGADGIETASLPQAEEFEIDSEEAARRRRTVDTKLWKRNALIGAAIITLAVVLLVSILVPRSKSSSDSDEGPSVNAAPTGAPTSLEGYLLSLLPPDTVTVIQDDTDSAQSRALGWLLNSTDDNRLELLTPERIQQRFALATFYYSTNGDTTWANNQGWLNHSVHECDWFRSSVFGDSNTIGYLYPGYLQDFFPTQPLPATCDDRGLYQHLWLDRNKLVGTLPEELYTMLTNLQTLSVAFNRLQGPVSSQIGNLQELEGIVMGNQARAGTIPTEIGLLSRLRAMVNIMSEHEGSIPTEMWQLTTLEYLLLAQNFDLQGSIPTSVGNMQKLKWLTFPSNDLSGTIPTQVGTLKYLEYLVLDKNRIIGTIPIELGQLPELQVLAIWQGQLTGTIPTELGLLPVNLMLTLRDNQLTGSIPSQFGLLKDLIGHLTLQNNSLTGTLPTELGALTDLYKIRFSENELSGQIPSEFGLMTSLGRLNLGNNSLSSTVPEALSALKPSLYALNLEGNAMLTGTIPDALCGINATCESSGIFPCLPNQGLTFDCTSWFHGCGCLSVPTNNTNTTI